MTQLCKREKVVRVYVSSKDEAEYEHMIDVLANAIHDLNTVELEGIIGEPWGKNHEQE